MKALLLTLFVAFAGVSFGQIKLNTDKLKEKTEKKLLKQDKKKKGKKVNSLAPGSQATESNRKRPGGTLNKNSNAKEATPVESKPKTVKGKSGGLL